MKYQVDIFYDGVWETFAMFAYISDAEFYATQASSRWPEKLVRAGNEGFTLCYQGGVEVVAAESVEAI
jgi:hypothetical protein